MKMLVKVHKATRYVVAICDSDLIDKKFSEENKQLDLTTDFFKGEEMNSEETEELIKDMIREDASFNIVGAQSCAAAINAGLIEKDAILKIDNIPVALTLL